MVTQTSLRLPTPSELFDALTISLGQLSGCEPGIPIHMDRLFFPTLDRVGIGDAERKRYQKQELLYPPRGRPNDPTLWRKFNLAFRYMKDRVRREPLSRVYQDCSRYYKLTPYGAQRSLQLLPIYDIDVDEFLDNTSLKVPEEPKENLTRRWFDQHWKEMQPKVRAYLSRHLEKSAQMGLSDDHIHTFLERAIRKDSFHKHLAAGNKIYPSTLCNFVMRSAYTEMRGWGSDGACRAIRGAVNERDRRRAKQFRQENPEYTTSKVYSKEFTKSCWGLGSCSFDDQEESGNGAMLDTFGGDLEADTLEMLCMEQTISQISSVIDNKLPEPDKHTEVFVLKTFDGMTYREIAQYKSIPQDLATAMIKRVRQTLQRAVKSGEINFAH